MANSRQKLTQTAVNRLIREHDGKKKVRHWDTEVPKMFLSIAPNGSAAWFLSMADARSRLNEWQDDYNENRPNSALGNLTPSAFAALLEPARKVA